MRPRLGVGAISVSVCAAPAATSDTTRVSRANSVTWLRAAEPPKSSSEKAIGAPANVSPAARGRTLMPARLRNACSSDAATRPDSANVTSRPSESA